MGQRAGDGGEGEEGEKARRAEPPRDRRAEGDKPDRIEQHVRPRAVHERVSQQRPRLRDVEAASSSVASASALGRRQRAIRSESLGPDRSARGEGDQQRVLRRRREEVEDGVGADQRGDQRDDDRGNGEDRLSPRPLGAVGRREVGHRRRARVGARLGSINPSPWRRRGVRTFALRSTEGWSSRRAARDDQRPGRAGPSGAGFRDERKKKGRARRGLSLFVRRSTSRRRRRRSVRRGDNFGSPAKRGAGACAALSRVRQRWRLCARRRCEANSSLAYS